MNLLKVLTGSEIAKEFFMVLKKDIYVMLTSLQIVQIQSLAQESEKTTQEMPAEIDQVRKVNQ